MRNVLDSTAVCTAALKNCLISPKAVDQNVENAPWLVHLEGILKPAIRVTDMIQARPALIGAMRGARITVPIVLWR